MRRSVAALPALLVFVACASQPTPPPVAQAAPAAVPVTETKPVTDVLHGVSVTDPYRWLEDQQSPETRAWIDRQNAYTDAVLGKLPQKQLADRLEALQKSDRYGLPIVRGGRYFYEKRATGADQYSIYMREGATGSERLLIDPGPMNPKHTTNVGIEDVSPDGKILAYNVRQGGADETEIRFFDVADGKDVGTAVPSARFEGISVGADDRTVYYSRFLEEGPRVFRRAIAGGAEERLFGDGYMPDKIVISGLSDDGRYLVIHVYHGSSGDKTEVYVKDLTDNSPIRTVVNDLDNRTTVDVAGDQLVIETNWNAPNNRVLVAPITDPRRANWKEIVPENRNASIQGVNAAGGKVFVRYLENVRPRIVTYDLSGQSAGEVSFDTLGNLEDLRGSWHSPTVLYSFSSFAVPRTIYAYDVASATKSIFARENAPVNPDLFTVDQVWYTSKDGTRVPMFLFYKKGLTRNGTSPTYLTAYGGFNVTLTPTYSPKAITWAENGGIYAVPNLRGGGEFGEAWHKAGMLANKQNVFDDFIAAGEYLISQNYTSPQHLGIAGGSNGGLLVTAIATQRPDLVKAVICAYPLVDMLRFQKFLVGSFWVPEYGSADDASQFPAIYAYSPYQHVVKGTKYPSILFITGDADTRVAPLHARKMTALMQASTGSSNPILLRYHVSGGHSGGEPLAEQVKNDAETLEFLLSQLR